MIKEEEIQHLAELARIEISAGQKGKLARDLEEILAYFDVLKEVNTEDVQLMTGGSRDKNVFRDDNYEKSEFNTQKTINAFPEKESGFLKVPPVFE
ncbi:MAG: Asp-tRNA(Asn)/Glu-tRNA(Gln) amidotransferase subunit GatC [Patescibacteria group bacterium]